ncbi:MAG: hypothetical protein ACRDZ5_05730 [Acidimicrobiales bacterium]
MNPLTSRGWQRMKVSLADEVHSRLARAELDSAEREAEMLRQQSDVFSELTRLAETLGGLHGKVDALHAKLDALHAKLDAAATAVEAELRELRELRDILSVQLDAENQSQELLGRLLSSARSRLDALEEAAAAETT